MKQLAGLLLCLSLLSSCTKKHLSNDELLLGDWVQQTRTDKYLYSESGPPDFSIPGFSFYKNHTFDNKDGYFKHIKDGSWGKDVYLGSLSKFSTKKDSLFLFRPDSNKWYGYKLIELNDDNLTFGRDGSNVSYKHLSSKETSTPEFDEIILSTSDCFGPCPVSDIIIKKNGDVFFDGYLYTILTGLFEGKISTGGYRQLQNNFRKTDFGDLIDNYTSRISDSQTITTTFVKDGRIYKTVSDYARQAPELFRWAYVPLEYLYQTVPLRKVSKPDFLPLLDVLTKATYELKNGDKVAGLNRSEAFLLCDYIRNGKISNNSVKVRFKLHPRWENHSFYNIDTDGRYFIFLNNGKPVTIDIGFNFYDVNEKIWMWRKATEND